MKRKAICAMLLLVLLLTGCGADISAYGDRQIHVIGLQDEDLYITPSDLANMKCVTETAVGGTVSSYGPTLDTFLAYYGRDKSEFQRLRLTAEDDYSVVLTATTWDRYTVIFAIANGTKPLEERQQPMRVVIPGGASGNWIRMVTEMRFDPVED